MTITHCRSQNEHLANAIAAIERKGGTVLNHPGLVALYAERKRRGLA